MIQTFWDWARERCGRT